MTYIHPTISLAQVEFCWCPGIENRKKKNKNKKNKKQKKTDQARPGGDRTSDIEPIRQDMASISHDDDHPTVTQFSQGLAKPFITINYY
jgi:hypothetical protein